MHEPGTGLTAQALSYLSEWEQDIPEEAKRDDVFHAQNAPLDWIALAGQTVPERQWALDHWLPMGAVTLLAGQAGIGKSLTAQSMASCLALQREYLELPSRPRKVLFWACEDDREELWRRQLCIAAWLKVELREFASNLILQSYDGYDTELAGLVKDRLVPTPNFISLQAQIADHKAEVVILDNIARIYGGSENDRHQVTTFIAMLTRAAAPTGAAIVLLGHPAKQAGSEYSGSTAWEASVRARLYLGNKLPDQPETAGDDEAEKPPEESDLSYLCRRKSNYSQKDWRRVRWINGVMVPEIDPREGCERSFKGNEEYLREMVLSALDKLTDMGMAPTASTASPSYLPKLAEKYSLLNGSSRGSFAKAMRDLQNTGLIAVGQVGKYPNRTPKFGLKRTN